MDPAWIHDVEQGRAALAEMAESMGYYRAQLIEAGFSKGAAEQMTADLHAAQIQLANAQQLGEGDG